MNTGKNIAKSILTSAVVVPLIGVATHFMPNKGAYFMDDASLAHRFECAYSLNPNPEHMSYTSYEYRPAGRYIETESGRRIPLNDDGDWYYDNSWIDTEESNDEFQKVCNKEDYTSPLAVWLLHAGVAGAAFVGLHRRDLKRLAAQKEQNVR